MPRYEVTTGFILRRDDYSERPFDRGAHTLDADDPDSQHPYFRACTVEIPGEAAPSALPADPWRPSTDAEILADLNAGLGIGSDPADLLDATSDEPGAPRRRRAK